MLAMYAVIHSYVCWTMRCPHYVPALWLESVGVDMSRSRGALILVLHTLPTHAFT